MLKGTSLKVLVVDDTVVYRKIVSDVLAEIPEIEVVGTAHNGKAALSKIDSLKPDLMTLDIEMPEMNGLKVLESLRQKRSDVGVIMLSTLTSEGGEMTMKALELGAFDFIPKPQSGTMQENRKVVKDAIVPIINAFKRSQNIRNILAGKSSKSVLKKESYTSSPLQKPRQFIKTSITKLKSEIVAIGISTGGPKALAEMLPKIPNNIGVPILIVQHMPPFFTQSLANSLDAKCHITIKEAMNNEPIAPNYAYIAPGGKQMRIEAGSDGKKRIIKITDDPPENSCKPSVDYLFRSIADHYVGRATGVIMTGMGSDGTKGLRQMKENGATIIAQNEESCVVFGMPKEPIESGLADIVVSLNNIASEILKTI
ncbi:MAG: chemotaxis response regulator protein-glutamate methylesterase [Desulfobacteraceae bacterium]|jgi:two-component system chemotaxis response regulator CheB